MGVDWPKHLKALTVVGGHLPTLSNIRFPDSLESFQLLAGLQTLENAVFPPFLRDLHLGLNDLVLLSGAEFPNLLKLLSLEYNAIELIDGVALPSGLANLSLGFNRVRNLKDLAFPSLLRQLDLTKNRIETLSGAELPDELKVLALSWNNLKSIDGCKLPIGLEELALDNNKIVEFPSVDLPSLKTLHLDFDDDEWETSGKGSLRRLSKIKLPVSLEYLLVRNQPVEDWSHVVLPQNLKVSDFRLAESPKLLKLPLSLQSIFLEFPEDSDSKYEDIQLPSGLIELGLKNGISSEFEWNLPSLVKFYAENFLGPITLPESIEEPYIFPRGSTDDEHSMTDSSISITGFL